MHEDVWNTTDVHRAIRRRIGETLSAGYDLSTPLPDRMRTLLDRLDEPNADGLCTNERPRPASLLEIQHPAVAPDHRTDMTSASEAGRRPPAAG
jgi:hypothetical protein